MKNRWLIAASAVGIHLSIGSVYAWSVVTKPLMAANQWSIEQVSVTFSIAIVCLGLAAAFLGRWVEYIGPRRAGLVSMCLFCGGLLLAGLASHFKQLWLLYLGYGVIGGIGIGIGYLAPVSTLLCWFPDKRGLATGIAIMGFGFAALASRPLMQPIIEQYGISNLFFILAGIYAVLMFPSSLYLAKPPQSYRLSAQTQQLTVKQESLGDGEEYCARRTIFSPKFLLLWLMFFINISCGIAIISVASPLAQETVGMTANAAAAMVGIVGLFNGLGRLFWSSLSDKIGRPALWITFFVVQIAAFLLLPQIHQKLTFEILLCLIVSCYGGGFASMPAFLSDLFGTKNVSAILGYMLTAWASGGIAGPVAIARIRLLTGSYQTTFRIFSVCLLLALVASILLWRQTRKQFAA